MKNIKVVQPLEIRTINDSKLEIKGLLPTNSPSQRIYDEKSDSYFTEVIKPLAFISAIEKEKPLLLINHDYSKKMKVISFAAKETKKGLEFTAIVRKDNISNELLIDKEKINGLSFGFIVGIDNWKGGYRYIYSFERLSEISVLKEAEPCYTATEVSVKYNKEQFETTEDVIRWVNRKRMEILIEKLNDLKKVSG